MLTAVAVSGVTAQEPFESHISRVRVDVLVHDGEGRFVADLVARDFRVYEDGKPQEILGVTLVMPEGEASPRPSVGSGARAAGSEAPATVPTRDVGALVYLVDARVLGRRERSRFLDGWLKSLATVETLRFPTAVYAINSAARLHLLEPLTTDAARIRAAGDELRAASYLDVDTDGPGPAGFAGGLVGFDVIHTLARSLRSRPGRKALVWVSAGVDWRLQGMGPFRVEAPIASTFEIDPRLERARRRAERAANTANVSIYGLDPSLLSEKARHGSAATSTGPVDMLLRDPLGLSLDRADRRRDSLRLAARATGGDAFLYHGSRVAEALRQIQEHAARYHLVTYATPEPEADGRYHEIRVEVDRTDVDVLHRPGYLDVSVDGRGGPDSGPVPGLVMDLPVRIVAVEKLHDDGTRDISLGISFHPGGDERSWIIEAQAVQEGRVFETRRQQITASEVARLREPKGGVVTGFDWPLEPGSYALRVAVHDEDFESMSTARLRLDLAEPCNGWCTTTPWLAILGLGGTPTPAFENAFATDERAAIRIDVFHGGRPTIGATVRARDGVVPVTHVEPVALVPGPDGLHSGSLPLPRDLPPGEYRIEVRLEDRPGRRARTWSMPISVVATPDTRDP